MVLLQRKLYFSKDPEGVQLFPGGPNANFYRNPYNLSFSSRGPEPLSPLWIRTCRVPFTYYPLSCGSAPNIGWM